MALIKCEECGQKVSDKAECCPNCGCPIETTKVICNECGNKIPIKTKVCPICGCPQDEKNELSIGKQSGNSLFRGKKFGIGVFITAFIIGMLLLLKDSPKDSSSSSSSSANVVEKTEETKEEDMLKKMVGTYKFDYSGKGRFNCAPIVVLPDGRCVILFQTIGGDIVSKLIGTVSIISDNVFTLINREDFILDLVTYVRRNDADHSMGSSYRWKWNCTTYIVFDLNEMRLYHDLNEYKNRDISEAKYAKITSHTTSTDLNQ